MVIRLQAQGQRTDLGLSPDGVDLGLSTYVNAISYDPSTGLACLEQPRFCCPDMTRCIRLFRMMFPDVQQIQTFSGGKLDIVYTRLDTEELLRYAKASRRGLQKIDGQHWFAVRRAGCYA